MTKNPPKKITTQNEDASPHHIRHMGDSRIAHVADYAMANALYMQYRPTCQYEFCIGRGNPG
jgi:hypothetical protein